jgi:glycosyltransferase involved in cell wall biosynthesis
VTRADTPVASVLIPAHQEEDVIERCLRALLGDSAPGEFEVVVVANGCTDGTVQIVQTLYPQVRLIEIAEASKHAALNVGDEELRCFPRLYVDADVELSAESARALVRALAVPQPLIASPTRDLQVTDCTLASRWFHRVWEALQRVRGEGIGAGVYAVNDRGRTRFERFPALMADDLFVFSRFRREERVIIPNKVKVWPPRSLTEILAVSTRVALGNRMAPRGPGTKDRPSGGAQIRRYLVAERQSLPGLPIYLGVTVVAKLLAQRRLRKSDLSWTRAERRGS